jgi:hypothetical protein
LSPRSIQNGLSEMMVLHHVDDNKVFYRNMVIPSSKLLRYFEMMVSTLPIDLQMGLRYILGTIKCFLSSCR